MVIMQYNNFIKIYISVWKASHRLNHAHQYHRFHHANKEIDAWGVKSEIYE